MGTNILDAVQPNAAGIGYGFAAGCAAVAVPRRLAGCITGLGPWCGLGPSDNESRVIFFKTN